LIDKNKFKNKMELLEASKLVQNGWEETFKDANPELKHISTLLDVRKKLGTYYPKPEDCFNAFKLCSLENIKVIIVGYQPDYGTVMSEGKIVSKTTGLSYSLRTDDTISKAVKNIYTELKNTVTDFQAPDHGNLEEWAKQGILFINNSLTVSQQKINIDVSELWYGFLNKVFKAIKKYNPNTIVLLWGRKVQCISKLIPDSFVTLETLSPPDGYKADTEFFGCNHFNKVNELLEKQNKTKINW
jgi:uracil-DNA glycosylase